MNSGTGTITTNGVKLAVPITFNGVGGSWELADDLNCFVATQRTMTLTNGSFDMKNKNVTCGVFNNSNSNTRSFTMGTGTLTVGSTGTVFGQATTTGLTFSGASGFIVVTDATSTSKTFAGGGLTYNKVIFTNVTSNAVTFSGANTIANLTFTNQGGTFTFPGSTTQQIASINGPLSGATNTSFVSSIVSTNATIQLTGNQQLFRLRTTDIAFTRGAVYTGYPSTITRGNGHTLPATAQGTLML